MCACFTLLCMTASWHAMALDRPCLCIIVSAGHKWPLQLPKAR